VKYNTTKIDKLINYEFNNKIHNNKQIDLLSNSIKEYWFNNPIIVDKNNIIIAWHWRFEAAKKLWLKEVPIIRKENLTEKQIKKYRLLDNKIAELATDNIENIRLELEELQDIELNELYDLDITTLKEENKEKIEDDVPEIQENIIVEKWDVFQLWEHRLMCWDSMDKTYIEKLLEWRNENITHCISDPPYWIAYTSDRFEMIKNDNTILDYTLLAEKYTNWYFCMWTWYQVVEDWIQLVKRTFNKLTNMIIWHKGGWWMWDCARNLAQDFEILLVSNRNNKLATNYRWSTTWYWNQEEKAEYLKKAKKEDIKKLLENIITWQSIWKVWKDNWVYYLHPTQKPVEINQRVLENFSHEWENILDLFWWSWSNLIACEKINRKCYMMELDEKYIQVIIKRYHTYTNWQKTIKCLNRNLDINIITNG